MAGLDPAIHAFPRKYRWRQGITRRHVDARSESGHDASPLPLAGEGYCSISTISCGDSTLRNMASG